MPADLVLIPFTVLWAGIAILMAVVALIGGSRMPTAIAISIIVVFGLAGLYLLVGRFVIKAILNGKTFYVVTTMDAIVTRGTTITRFPLHQHTVEINRTRRSGHASVYFGIHQAEVWMLAISVWISSLPSTVNECEAECGKRTA